MGKLKYTLHAEIILNADSNISPDEIEPLLLQELQHYGNVHPGSTLNPTKFTSEILKRNVSCVVFGDISELLYHYKLETENPKSISVDKVCLEFHAYRLEEQEIESEQLCVGNDSENELISAANYCLLPHKSFHGIWESLVFDDNIKENLLEYASTSMIFSQHNVNTNVICWNRVILLYGPPGTGKTSLCKGLAQKLSVRLKRNYELAEFIEINSHSLFSKYYSESGKLVMQMFNKIKEHLEYGKSLVCVLIDEIESLTHARNSCMNGAEPSDSIRVVNAVLTQLDQIRKYPNVLILTTSNLKNAIDMAFVDRADLQIYIGPPSVNVIYAIFVSCLEELIRVEIVKLEKEVAFLSSECISQVSEKPDFDSVVSIRLHDVAKLCKGMSGRILRKIPFLAYSKFSKSEERSILDYVEALKIAVNQYRLNNKNIYNTHSS